VKTPRFPRGFAKSVSIILRAVAAIARFLPSATLRYVNSASAERLEYAEGDHTIAAERELRPVAVLV